MCKYIHSLIGKVPLPLAHFSEQKRIVFNLEYAVYEAGRLLRRHTTPIKPSPVAAQLARKYWSKFIPFCSSMSVVILRVGDWEFGVSTARF